MRCDREGSAVKTQQGSMDFGFPDSKNILRFRERKLTTTRHDTRPRSNEVNGDWQTWLSFLLSFWAGRSSGVWFGDWRLGGWMDGGGALSSGSYY